MLIINYINLWVQWGFAKLANFINYTQSLCRNILNPQHPQNQQQLQQQQDQQIKIEKDIKIDIDIIIDITSNQQPNNITLLPKHMIQQQQQSNPHIATDNQLQQLILLTKALLEDLIQNQGNQCQSIFNSHERPSISLQAYLRRIHKYTKFSPQCLIIAIIYMDRYNMAQCQFSLNWLNVHRMFLTCLMLAVKFNDDIYFDNMTFQKGGGVSAHQLFQFQIEVFQKIGFNAYVDWEQYQALVQKLYGVYGCDTQ